MKMNEAKHFCGEYITRRAKSALNNEADKYIAESASELSTKPPNFYIRTNKQSAFHERDSRETE